MPYFDCTLVPLPAEQRDAYCAFSERFARVYREHDAVRVIDCVLDPEPQDDKAFHAVEARPALGPAPLPDFRVASGARTGELVLLSWTEWPSRAVRDAALPRVLADPRVQPKPGQAALFQGARMIAGGFACLVDA